MYRTLFWENHENNTFITIEYRDTKKVEPKDLEYFIFFFELWAFQ
jgi:hypothetical protein